MASSSLSLLVEQQNQDSVCRKLRQYSARGWPSRQDVSVQLKGFWDYKDQIAVEDGVLVCGSRVVVPENCQSVIWKCIHEGHLGMDKCKARARQFVWWPKINDDIGRAVSSCHVCLQARVNRKLPLQPTTFPELPW